MPLNREIKIRPIFFPHACTYGDTVPYRTIPPNLSRRFVPKPPKFNDRQYFWLYGISPSANNFANNLSLTVCDIIARGQPQRSRGREFKRMRVAPGLLVEHYYSTSSG